MVPHQVVSVAMVGGSFPKVDPAGLRFKPALDSSASKAALRGCTTGVRRNGVSSALEAEGGEFDPHTPDGLTREEAVSAARSPMAV